MSEDNPSDDDNKLFRETMRALGVEAQSSDKVIQNKAIKTTSPSRAGNADQQSIWPTILYKDLEPESSASSNTVSAQLAAQSVQFNRGGMTLKNRKRLQRGHYSIAAQLDLHGMTVDQAIIQLNETVNHIQLDNQQCLLIIHGKGYHSQGNSPKLKSLSERWLRAHPRTLAFCSAQAKDGGTGAVYVLLKRQP